MLTLFVTLFSEKKVCPALSSNFKQKYAVVLCHAMATAKQPWFKSRPITTVVEGLPYVLERDVILMNIIEC